MSDQLVHTEASGETATTRPRARKTIQTCHLGLAGVVTMAPTHPRLRRATARHPVPTTPTAAPRRSVYAEEMLPPPLVLGAWHRQPGLAGVYQACLPLVALAVACRLPGACQA